MNDQEKKASMEGADARDTAESKWPRVAVLADRLRALREQNHFAEIIDRALLHPPRKGSP